MLGSGNNLSPPKLPFNDSEIVSICSRSVAPSIYGHEELKKAVLLMLMGG
jgi:DNA replicative helicase MCM subunit Mcm2 (Cdc46/Mcm family)